MALMLWKMEQKQTLGQDEASREAGLEAGLEAMEIGVDAMENGAKQTLG